MKLQTRIWASIESYAMDSPIVTIDDVEGYPQPTAVGIAICYVGGNLVVPNSCIVDTIEVEE